MSRSTGPQFWKTPGGRDIPEAKEVWRRRPTPPAGPWGLEQMLYLGISKDLALVSILLFFSWAGTVGRTTICSTVEEEHAKFINDFSGPTTTLCEHIREYQRINVIDRADEPAKARS